MKHEILFGLKESFRILFDEEFVASPAHLASLNGMVFLSGELGLIFGDFRFCCLNTLPYCLELSNLGSELEDFQCSSYKIELRGTTLEKLDTLRKMLCKNPFSSSPNFEVKAKWFKLLSSLSYASLFIHPSYNKQQLIEYLSSLRVDISKDHILEAINTLQLESKQVYSFLSNSAFTD